MKTIKEISAAINKENFERFMVDFTKTLYYFCELKEADPDLLMGDYEWTDDNINTISFYNE